MQLGLTFFFPVKWSKNLSRKGDLCFKTSGYTIVNSLHGGYKVHKTDLLYEKHSCNKTQN